MLSAVAAHVTEADNLEAIKIQEEQAAARFDAVPPVPVGPVRLWS